MTFSSNKLYILITKHFSKVCNFQDNAVILETNHILEISSITSKFLNSLSQYFIGYIYKYTIVM